MILSHILTDHDPVLVLLALLTCLLGAFAGMTFWSRCLHDTGSTRLSWGFLTAIVLGPTVWTTHFVSMLAYYGSNTAQFELILTVVSVFVSTIGLALAVICSVLIKGHLSSLMSGLCLGIGVALMHFTGMLGFEIGQKPAPDDIGLWSSLLIGTVLGWLTMHSLQRRKTNRHWPGLPVALFALTVTLVHFSAMSVYHANTMPPRWTAASPDHTLLAFGVAVTTVVLIVTAVAGYTIQMRHSISAAEALRQTARTDALTGLANRTSLALTLERYCIAQDRGGQDFTLFFIDLDRFKAINEGFGHAIGDEVLRRAAGRLRAMTEPADFVARLGGDEFAVILHDTNPYDVKAERLAHRTVDVMARPFLIEGMVIEIGASVGLGTWSDESSHRSDDLIKNTEMALYAAKSAGRGTWHVFDRSIADRFDQRRKMEFDLRRAIARNEFVMYYQPLVDSRTGRYRGAEALLRWAHPTQGILGPDKFLPLAEELGLLNPIGKWIIESTCNVAATWPDHMIVAINLSPMQLLDNRIVHTVRGALDRSGLPPHRLELELTENALISAESAVIATLQQLRQLGVLLALDDFGTGFSSLSYLHRLPLDRIKIDRSFVNLAESDAKSARIVETIGVLGQNLGLGVTAEGIETDWQRTLVTNGGCDVLQGYLYSPPVPLEDLLDLFSTGQDNAPKARMTGL